MKYLFTLFLMYCVFASCGYKESSSQTHLASMNTVETASSFYSFKMKSIGGETINFSAFKGKKVMLVNVASKCGYTPQYEKLQQLHEKYGDKVVLLGFPANNFGSQEPGSNSEIAEFCKLNYGVSFRMFEKISVLGEDQHPLYQWLSKKELNGVMDQAPTWNFCKYLINEKGELVKFFSSKADPMGEEILTAIKG